MGHSFRGYTTTKSGSHLKPRRLCFKPLFLLQEYDFSDEKLRDTVGILSPKTT